MTETILPALRAWLAQASALAGIPALTVDLAAPAPGLVPAGGLAPQGVQILGGRQNLLGRTTLHCRARFILRLCLPFAPGDDALAAANAARLLALRRWVAAESAARRAPVFGDEPARERLSADNGRLEQLDREGWAAYRVVLTADFVENYEPE